MKIDLNLPALERLIGGDTEIELSLRKQLVQEFAKRHLKEVIDNEIFQETLKAAKAYVNQAAKETFNIENLVTSHLWPTLGSRLQSLIEKYVEEIVFKVMDESLKKHIDYQKSYWGRAIDTAIKRAMEQQIEKAVQEGIQQRLEAAKSIK